jgi:hypothetical protein
MSAESESVSESEKKFCGSESKSEKKVFGATTLILGWVLLRFSIENVTVA